jgi:hypothetical protein
LGSSNAGAEWSTVFEPWGGVIMENAYTEKFGAFVCDGDTIETTAKEIKYVARIVHDQDSHIDDDDIHNVNQEVTGCNDEQQAKLLEARAAWFKDEWFYCGVVISASKAGISIDRHAASLWSIDANYPGSDNSYLTDVANELLEEARIEAEKRLDYMIRDLQSGNS